jgi:hypothetical protein
MSDGRPWYREPESFIALAALVVSISAVAVGLYEASLQRAHDRAEVWPHVEVGTFTTNSDATVYLENTGVGPAMIESVVFTVDSQPRRGWNDLVGALFGKSAPDQFGRETVLEHALRAGEKVVVLDLPINAIPSGFWTYIKRVGVAVCYRSVFDQHWTMSHPRLGGGSKTTWTEVSGCPAQPDSTSF